MNNHTDRFFKTANNPESLKCEQAGLIAISELIHRHHIETINTPHIFTCSDSVLELEKIVEITPARGDFNCLAKGLSQLHSIKQQAFGWPYDNFIGLSEQKNTLTDNWGKFFLDMRLGYQIAQISDDKIRREFLSILHSCADNLENYLNENTPYPSLIHGDLWQGNVMFGKKCVYLIDPAVYWGDREADIAMTQMFGGFSQNFYQLYNEYLPLSSHYQTKKIIYNLYHYLNHYNLFGSAYLNTCIDYLNTIKRRFT